MKPMEKNAFELKNLRPPLIILLSFWTIAIVFWRTSGNIFLLFNFGYIGTAVGVGTGLYIILPRKKKPSGRRFAQLLIGIYMLVFLGIIKQENMQLEGFFFYLLAGLFLGSVIHYLVAKIFGPILFGRGYCDWSCWTAMVLDFLPFKRNKTSRVAAKWELLKYIHFVFSLLLILILWFLFQYTTPKGQAALVWLGGGNILYFALAIFLAFTLKDNKNFLQVSLPNNFITQAYLKICPS